MSKEIKPKIESRKTATEILNTKTLEQMQEEVCLYKENIKKEAVEEFKKMLIQEIEKVTFDIEIGEHLRDGLLDFEEVQEIINNIN